MNILIVEDDAEIARLTQLYLQSEGYDTTLVTDGIDAVQAIRDLQPDLVLLDIMLPNVDGYEICQLARRFYQGPILVLTAKEDDMSEVSLLKFGADDYLRKPVRPHIMSARIEALLRRSTNALCVEKPIGAKRLTINNSAQTVLLDNESIDLTDAEFELLVWLYDNKGKAVSREACIQALRGISYDITDRSIDMRISGLRKKLKDESSPYQLIKTVRNKGYMLVDE